MWNGFIGNKEVVDYFKEIYKNKKIGQSYLYYGPDGVGKKYFAVLLAKSLLCKNKEFLGCNECIACKKVNKGIHNDLNIYEPMNKGISIDQVRLIIQRLKYKPIESDYSIHIVDAVETMRIEAANAFLKVIEEPPEYALIILITTLLEMLPSTVRSRCQVIRFNKISADEIKRELMKLNIEEEKAKFISLWCDGSYSKALTINYENYLVLRNQAYEIFKYILKESDKTFPDLLPVLFKRDKSKSDYLKENFDIILYFLYDLIQEAIHLNLLGESFHHSDIKDELMSLCKRISIEDMFELIRIMEDIKQEFKVYRKDQIILLQKLILKNKKNKD